jgi:hypothetical protein
MGSGVYGYESIQQQKQGNQTSENSAGIDLNWLKAGS